ncbi:MAG: biotin/lipoyl-containing protein, partial [Pseudomonadota bacterium]
MSTEIRVPTLGESVTEATVATWFKKSGDAVSADEMICELETDKVTVEVPAPTSGTLGEIVAPEGETVGVDALLAMINEGASASAAPAASPTAKTPAAKSETNGAAIQAEASVDVMVPTLGESVTEATVSAWFKSVGDTVEADEMLCELETDKVSVEVPAPAAGTLTEILAKEGETVEAGGKLAVMGAGVGTPATAAPAPADAPAPPAAAAVPTTGGKDIKDAPSAEKAMAEAGLSRDDVQGTGRDGRIMKEDVARAAANPAPVAAEAPAPVSTPRGPVAAEDAAREERVKMTRL